MANILTNKLGPLPTWGWLGIVTGGGIGYYLYAKNKAGATATPTTGSGQIPDYIFQNYNQIPPSAGTPGPGGHHHGKTSGGTGGGGKGKHPGGGKGGPDTDQNKDEGATATGHGGGHGSHATHGSGLRSITPGQAAHLVKTGHKAVIKRRHGKPYLTGTDYQKLINPGGHNHPGQYVPPGVFPGVNPGGPVRAA